jgi:hypothetical protein
MKKLTHCCCVTNSGSARRIQPSLEHPLLVCNQQVVHPKLLTMSEQNLSNVNMTVDDVTRLKGSKPAQIKKKQCRFIFEPAGSVFEPTYNVYATLY